MSTRSLADSVLSGINPPGMVYGFAVHDDLKMDLRGIGHSPLTFPSSLLRPLTCPAESIGFFYGTVLTW